MHLYLVRHSQPENIPTSNPSLSLEGVLQSQVVGSLIQNDIDTYGLKPGVIYTSCLERAVQTAHLVNGALYNRQRVQEDPRLNELVLPVGMEGLKRHNPKVQHIVEQINMNLWNPIFTLLGSETYDHFATRINAILAEIMLHSGEDEAIILASHRKVINLAAQMLMFNVKFPTFVTFEQFRKQFTLDYSEVVCFSEKDGRKNLRNLTREAASRKIKLDTPLHTLHAHLPLSQQSIDMLELA